MPAGQPEHRLGSFVRFLYMPAGQALPPSVEMHSVAPGKEYSPRPQGVQLEGSGRLGAGPKVFAGQGEGALELVAQK